MKIINILKSKNNKKQKSAFTIVELVVVIVVIGILATITIVSYGNWQKTVAETQIKSDLKGAAIAMEDYKSKNGKYPSSVPATFEASSGTKIDGGSMDGGSTFSLIATKNNLVYGTTNNSEPALKVLAIGDAYGGGKIAYLFQSGDSGYIPGQQHGLIMATVDQSSGISYSNITNAASGATYTAVGKGQYNTSKIIAQANHTTSAAKLCDDYTITVGGVTYSDWYLPSSGELYKILQNFPGTGYLSSTEINESTAIGFHFSINPPIPLSQSTTLKWHIMRVRAVRSF